MDTIMQNRSRGLTDRGYSNFTISDFENNPWIISNPQNANYATQINLQLPLGSECTPIEINGVKVTSISNGQSSSHFFRFGDANWQAADVQRMYKATKYLRDGSTTSTHVAELTIGPLKYMALLKLSATNENGYEFCTIYNPYNVEKTFVVEVPAYEEQRSSVEIRGWKDWIKRIYKGVMFVADLASFIPGPIGAIASAITTFNNSVNAVVAPTVDLDDVDIRAQRIVQRQQSRKVFEYTRKEEDVRNDGIRANDVLEVTDEDMATFDSNFFDPILN